jgi:hypothetical protein
MGSFRCAAPCLCRSALVFTHVAFTATPSTRDKGLQVEEERYTTLFSRLNATAMSPNSS